MYQIPPNPTQQPTQQPTEQQQQIPTLDFEDSVTYEDSFDVFEEYEKMLGEKVDDEVLRRLRRNHECLTILIEGDLIEYVASECDMEEKDIMRNWAVYMGNSMIMRFDNKKKAILYESYWRIASENYVFINRDLDKRLLTLPIYETLNRARKAHEKTLEMSKNFVCDKYFAMWCRFDINKSDLEKSTDNGSFSPKEAKEFLFEKFFSSFSEAEILPRSPAAKKPPVPYNSHAHS